MTDTLTRTVRTLAAYSLPIYVVGLAVASLPRALAYTGRPVSTEARWVLVGTALGVMLLTYLAEREVRADRDDGYSLQARASVAMGLVGVAAGIYVAAALERPFVGALFALGAYFFARMAFDREGDGGAGGREGEGV